MTNSPRHTTYADVILPLAIPNYFTYSVPSTFENTVKPGSRVEVQFGKKKLYAAVVRQLHQTRPEEYKVKPVLSVLDENPLLTLTELTFWEWIAEYYMCTVGEVMNAALPTGLKLHSETRVYLNPRYEDREPQLEASLSSQQAILVKVLQEKKSTSLSELQSVLDQKTLHPLLDPLLEQEIIHVQEDIKQVFKPKKVPFVKLSQDYQQETAYKSLLEDLENAPKQLQLVLAYQDLLHHQQKIRKQDLLKRAEASSSPLKALEKKGVFEIQKEEVERLQADSRIPDKDFELTEPQQQALQNVRYHFEEERPALLHGVTSSGKTHLYIRLIEEALEQEQQVLYLLPEIALTAQLISRLREYFGNTIGVYHSKFNPSERVEIWQKVRNQEYQIILGPRSALFLPYPDLGLVIVDEEHETTYKQFNPAPRYQARDSAIYLSKLHGAHTILGTATPSLESYFNAQIGKFGYVEMKERYGGIQLPEIVLADWRKETKSQRESGHFTSRLLEAMENALSQGEQIILFQNRRGYVPYLECNMCGWTPYCQNCEVSMTYHKSHDELQCHYCGYMRNPPRQCPACGSTDIKVNGFGTERVEEELDDHFPDAAIQRMDLDTTQGKYGHSKIIADFESGRTDILVGTQMVTKGLDFDNVTVVGILSAENLLNYPNFRANEHAFQLMAQVSGRAGRRKKQGHVIIQTYQPKHPVIQYVKNYQFTPFYKDELAQRKQFHYPPYFRMIKLTLKHSNKKKVVEASERLATLLKPQFDRQVSGPVEPLIPRIRNQYLMNLILRFDIRRESVVKAKERLRPLLTHFSTETDYKSVRLQVNVDPVR